LFPASLQYQLVQIQSASPKPLSTQQIGRLGELLVQYELLRFGIESAPLTSDASVDLVAYSGRQGRSFTFQVKAKLAPRPGGEKGALAIDWWAPEYCPAELYALVDLFTRRIWMFKKEKLAARAKYAKSDSPTTAQERHGEERFARFLFPSCEADLFR
jgi:hypothetical protein